MRISHLISSKRDYTDQRIERNPTLPHISVIALNGFVANSTNNIPNSFAIVFVKIALAVIIKMNFVIVVKIPLEIRGNE